MSGRSRKLLQGIVLRITKSPILYNASSAIENASGRAQVQLANMQHVAAEKYDRIVKQVNGTTIVQDLQAASLKQSSPIPERLVNWWRWYQQLTGIEDVEVAKEHVIAVQDKLFKCQDERRHLNNQAGLIAEKLKEVYGELVQTRRDDPKYVQLTIMENKGLQEQSRIGAQLRLLENAERDHFTQLATAIKEYHDSQAMNAQKYKYLSILASATLAIVSLCGSMIYNNRRIRDVRIVIAEAQQKNETMLKEYFGSLAEVQEKNETMFREYFHSLESKVTGINNNVTPSNSSDFYTPPMETETIFTPTNICIAIVIIALYKAFS